MKWFHALSLDVVIGALAVGLFASRVLQVSPPGVGGQCWPLQSGRFILLITSWMVITRGRLHKCFGINCITESSMYFFFFSY